MQKRSPKEVLKALDGWDGDDAIDAEMQRVLEMTPEERENELRAAGLDVQAERAKAAAFLHALTSDAPSSNQAGEPSAEPAAWVTQAAPPKRATPATRWATLLAATLAAAATGGGVLYALGHRSKPNEKPVEAPREVPTVTAPRETPPQDMQSAPPPTPPPRDLKAPPQGRPHRPSVPAQDFPPRDIKDNR